MTYRLPDPRASADGTVIRTVPHRYVTGPEGEYRHLPRTVATWGAAESVETLCGQTLHGAVWGDSPDAAACGTCAGRALGLEHDAYRYRPRTVHTLPAKWCRGSGARGSQLVVPIEGDRRRVLCLMCRQTVAYRAGRSNGYWTAPGGAVQHPHGGTGVACPHHGATDLAHAYRLIPQPIGPDEPMFVPAGEPRPTTRWVHDYNQPMPRLVCTAHRCDLTPHRFWIITPHGRTPA